MIDSHVHFWKLGSNLDYSWVNGSPLERDFLPEDFAKHSAANLVDKIVFVEAGCPPTQGVEEAQWVASLAENERRIAGIVAAAPLENGAAVRTHLEALAQIPLVKGVRRLIQSEEAGFSTQPDFVAGVKMLQEFGFSFDICIRHHQMRDAIALVEQCPEISFVLDHIGKPDIKGHVLNPWRDEIKMLADFPNVWCKVSGMVTEADYEQWTPNDLKPYIDHVINVFGISRVMFGGDWPVSTLATTYPHWLETLQWATQQLKDEDQNQLFHANAQAFYRLEA